MKYPYIGKTSDGTVVLFSAKKTGARINGEGSPTLFGYSNCWVESCFTDITREYLTNTYGKCESQEHADFICKLALNAGFVICKYNPSRDRFFCFIGKYLCFLIKESAASEGGGKLISLPMPPSKKEIPSTQVIESEQVSQFPKMEVNTPMPQVKSSKQEKPVYTKEMKENGEVAPVGSEVLTVSGVGVVRHHILVVAIGEQEFFIKSTDVNPPPTIEDELCKLVRSYYGGTSKAKDLANEILSKYNITQKEDQ